MKISRIIDLPKRMPFKAWNDETVMMFNPNGHLLYFNGGTVCFKDTMLKTDFEVICNHPAHCVDLESRDTDDKNQGFCTQCCQSVEVEVTVVIGKTIRPPHANLPPELPKSLSIPEIVHAKNSVEPSL